jgi:subtilase family serine protease
MPLMLPTALSTAATTSKSMDNTQIPFRADTVCCLSAVCLLLVISVRAESKDCGTFTPAKVISTSYGYNEADLTPAYTSRQCTEYAKLGMMGVTFVYSSGDNGVAGNGGLCLNPDGESSPLHPR